MVTIELLTQSRDSISLPLLDDERTALSARLGLYLGFSPSRIHSSSVLPLIYYTTMASQSKGKSPETVIERPGINWRETLPEGSSLILSVVKEAAKSAPIAELKKAACLALLIFKSTQVKTLSRITLLV
jgi:hypothetical protein